MAYSTESGIWRNYFLTGAWRNRCEDVRRFLDSDINGDDGIRSRSGGSGCGNTGVGSLVALAALALLLFRRRSSSH